MAWRRASRRVLSSLEGLFRSREIECVNLVSRINSAGGLRLPDRNDAILIIDERQGRIESCLYLSRHGLALPLLPAGLEDDPGVLRKLTHPFLDHLYTVIGPRSYAESFRLLSGRKPLTVRHYHLLGVDPPRTERGHLPPGISLQQATAADAARLFELQKAYEMEEVLLDRSSFDEARSLRNFEKSLGEETILYAAWRGIPVAKAGTNAHGLSYDQIGGVYTAPAWRGQGIARGLMSELMRIIGQRGRRACLFVKKSNETAVRLYEGLGFRSHGDFTIEYFRT